MGDGSTDDTAAIQAALNDLKNVRTNNWSVLYFPAGTYIITQQLTTSRSTHEDYLGANIIGQEPNTTIIKWAGPQGGNMLWWDAWYDKISRLTFDGSSSAYWAIVRKGSFSTASELSDLIFHDFTGGCINLGNGESQGIAEELITRSRFYRCGTAIATWNYNTLDIWVWHNYFEDNSLAVHSATGDYQVYDNRFVRSSTADLSSYMAMSVSFVNNISLGSKSFMTAIAGSIHIQGNKVYGATNVPFDLSASQNTFLDNVIQGPDTLPALAQIGGRAGVISLGNTYITNNPFPMRPIPHGVIGSCDANNPVNLVNDGDPSTFAVVWLGTGPFAGFQWSAPIGTQPTVMTYALTEGGPATCGGYGADPSNWVLKGSNDFGQTWTILDSRAGETFTPGQRKVYTVATPGSYAFYQLEIQQTANGTPEGQYGVVSLGEFELLDNSGTNLSLDPAGLMTNADTPWGSLYVDQQTIISPASAQIPNSLTPFDFEQPSSAPIIEVSGFTGDAIQAAINQAVAMPVGTNPVIHLAKGTYVVTSMITVPANIPITIQGDGSSQNGSDIVWHGAARVPATMWLQGPSRVTLRDLAVSGSYYQYSTSAGLLIDNADQQGGRVYGYETWGYGDPNGGSQYGIDAEGIDYTDINLSASEYGAPGGTGAHISGGPLRARGQNTPGRMQILTGSGGADRLFDVSNGGQLISTGFWYEDGRTSGYHSSPAELDLSGTLVLAAMFWALNNPNPMVVTNSFNGTFTWIGMSPYNQNLLSFNGDGSNTNILFANSTLNTVTPGEFASEDQTSPAGNIAAVTTLTQPVTNKVVGASPSNAFLEHQLAPLRAIDTTAAVRGPAGVTDVKLLRVNVGGGSSQTALKILGTCRFVGIRGRCEP